MNDLTSSYLSLLLIFLRECHTTMTATSREVRDPQRRVIMGIIQLGVTLAIAYVSCCFVSRNVRSTKVTDTAKSNLTDRKSHHVVNISTETRRRRDFDDNSHDLPNSDDTDEFGLFFESNLEEMTNIPVTFDNPLPAWLQGTFVRNGLGMFENGPRTFLHAFDGFAKLASWRFTGNETFFSTRFIRSAFYRSSKREKTISPYLLFQAVDPPFGYFEKAQCLINGIDNMNVNVYGFQNPKNKVIEYAALSDFWIVYKITIDTLSTKHRVVPTIKQGKKAMTNLKSVGFLNLLSSSHPLPEPGTTNHLNFLSSVAVLPWGKSVMNIMRVKSLKRRSVLAQWTVDRVPYMHSFSVTRTKVILLASPLYVNVLCMAWKVEPFSCLDWYPDQPATLYVVDLKSGNLTTLTMENIFTMHHVNAYNLNDTSIIMDVSSYPSPDFVNHLQLHILRDPVKRNSFSAHAKLKRIHIDLLKLEAREIPIDRTPIPHLTSLLDMPVINEAYRSKHYCFVYGLVLKADNITLSNIAIVKKDLCHGGKEDRVWRLDAHYPVEPWFVANPRAVDEDDGLLLIAVLHGSKRVTYLVILNAKNFTLVSKAVMPTNIPYSLHGRFFPSI